MENKSVDEIIEKRGMARSTIYGHLIQGISDGKIKPEQLIPEAILLDMIDIMKQNPQAKKLSELKAITGDDFSYDELRIALAYMKRLTC